MIESLRSFERFTRSRFSVYPFFFLLPPPSFVSFFFSFLYAGSFGIGGKVECLPNGRFEGRRFGNIALALFITSLLISTNGLAMILFIFFFNASTPYVYYT